MTEGPWEHPWRQQTRDYEHSQTEALWAIAAELRELNQTLQDDE